MIMISKKIILSAISGLIVLASANVYAAQLLTKDVLAREATEAPCGLITIINVVVAVHN